MVDAVPGGEEQRDRQHGHGDEQHALQAHVFRFTPGEKEQRVGHRVEPAEVIGVHAERGEEGARGGQRQRAEAHAFRRHVADRHHAHHPDRDDERDQEALHLLRLHHRLGDDQRGQHHQHRLEQQVAQVAQRVGEVDHLHLVEVRVHLVDVARADQAGDGDGQDEKPEQLLRHERAQPLAADQVRDERGEQHQVQRIQAGDAEHAVRKEITAFHRQHDEQQHRADAEIGEYRGAGQDGEARHQGLQLADGEAEAADDAEKAEADNAQGQARIAFSGQPCSRHGHLGSPEKLDDQRG